MTRMITTIANSASKFQLLKVRRRRKARRKCTKSNDKMQDKKKRRGWLLVVCWLALVCSSSLAAQAQEETLPTVELASTSEETPKEPEATESPQAKQLSSTSSAFERLLQADEPEGADGPTRATELDYILATTDSSNPEPAGFLAELESHSTTLQPDSTRAAELANTASVDETGELQLIRNRKASGASGQSANKTLDGLTTNTPARRETSLGQVSQLADYDDFDLDFQLKPNATGANSSSSENALNKRDHDQLKAPNWTALVPSHVFTANQSEPPPPPGGYNPAGPMMPAVLTLGANQLSSQELNRLRPQFLLYSDHYDQNGNFYQSELNQAAATGDLLATASNSAPPVGLNQSESAKSMISLMNGSPVVRQRQQEAANRSALLSNLLATGRLGSPTTTMASDDVTTIVVDSTTSEQPTMLSSSSSTTTSTTTAGPTTTSTTSASTTPANSTRLNGQWFNYPHPNLHHNPLLLHHLFNNPSIYAQHVASGQNSALPSTVAASSTTPSYGDAPTSSSVIEKPAYGAASVHPAPINRTQLHMQLNELRTMAAMGQAKQPQTRGQQSPTRQPEQTTSDFLSHLIGSRPQQAAELSKLLPIKQFQQLSKPASQIMAAPSLQQEVYTPRPASMLTESSQKKLSDEDMSTYVSELASLGSPVSQLTGNGWLPTQALATNSTSSAATVNELETLIRELANEAQQAQRAQTATAASKQESQLKLMALSDDVQLQLYRDHLAPFVQSKAGKAPLPPYSALMVGSPSNVKPTLASQLLEELTSPADSSNPLRSFASPNQQQRDAYYSIEGHQEQQKRERERQQMSQVLAELKQQQRQVAFIEALRSSLMRLPASSNLGDAHVTQAAPAAQQQNDLDQLSSALAAFATQASNKSQPTNENNEQSSKPDWLERQIIQESLVHETTRMHPFGQVAKTTMIGRPMLLPPVPHLRPLHHHPMHHPPLYPIGRLRPAASGFAFHQQPAPFGRGFAPPPAFFPRPPPPPPPPLMHHPDMQMAAGAPMTPTRIMMDRFPLASAPAYLVKLPTLTGGTITASGSLVSPFRSHLNGMHGFHGRPAGPLRFLGSPPRGLRLLGPPGSPYLQSHHLHTAHSQPGGSFASYYSPRPPLRPLMPLDSGHHHHHYFQQAESSPTGESATSVQQPAVESSVGKSVSSSQLELPAGKPLQQAASYPAQLTRYEPHQQQVAGQTHMTLQDSAASALSRLQQATASLVELTSLASLVEEMVSGSDADSSPALALANAINSLSAASQQQQQQQGRQQQSLEIGQQLQQGRQQQQLQQPNPFSWRNLLNPALWRDKALIKGKDIGAFERLVANAARGRSPQAKLKVKYIRVPVAVYETNGMEQQNNNGRGQLVTKTQLAELGPAASSSSNSPSNAIQTNIDAASQVAAQPSPLSNRTPAGSSLGGGQTSGSQAAGSSLPAASSADYLYDELGSDSAPPIALALQDQQHFHDDKLDEGIPMLATLRPLHMASRNRFQMEGAPGDMFYSMASSPTGIETASPVKIVKDKRKGKKRGKKEDDDEEDADDDDDDDLLSSNDLPLLESIVSTLVHGPNHPAYNPPIAHPAHSSFNLLRPFGSSLGARPEASNVVETYAHPGDSNYLNPFGRHSHKFSLGEVVGALGAKKLISSLFSKRKTSRATSKRAVGQTNGAHERPMRTMQIIGNKVRKPVAFLPAAKQATTTTTTSTTSTTTVNPEPHSSTTHRPALRFPSIAAHNLIPKSAATKRPLKKTQQSKFELPVISKDNTLANSTAQSAIVNHQPETSSSPRRHPSTTTSRLVPLSYKSHDDLHYSFFLKTNSNNDHPTYTSAAMLNDNNPNRLRAAEKMAMPLYHVVADHYSKLHSGPTLQKTINDQGQRTSTTSSSAISTSTILPMMRRTN